MKRPEEYTRKEIKEIWDSNRPGCLIHAFTLMEIKCSFLEQQVKNLNIPIVSVAVCECLYAMKKKNYDECAMCGGKWKGRKKQT